MKSWVQWVKQICTGNNSIQQEQNRDRLSAPNALWLNILSAHVFLDPGLEHFSPIPFLNGLVHFPNAILYGIKNLLLLIKLFKFYNRNKAVKLRDSNGFRCTREKFILVIDGLTYL